MLDWRHTRSLAAASLLVFLSLTPVAAQLSPERAGKFRVIMPMAAAHERRDVNSDIVATLRAGTVVDVIDEDSGWYWVILPPDAYGIRRPAWLVVAMLEAVSPPETESATEVGTPPAGPPGAEAAPVPTVPAPRTRGFAQGFGSLTFGTETSFAGGGGVGLDLTPNVQFTIEAGWLRNVLPKALQRDLDDAARVLQFALGIPVDFDARLPTGYGMGGLRYTPARYGRLEPFVGVGVGAARVTLDLDARAAGVDVSGDVKALLSGASSSTELLVSGMAGLSFAATPRTALDLGYKYYRVFTDDPAINVSSGFVMLNLRF